MFEEASSNLIGVEAGTSPIGTLACGKVQSMFNLLTEGAEAGASSMSGLLMILIYVVVIGGAFYLMTRGQRKEQKRLQALIASVEVGDVVVTSSGFYGVIISVQDDDCIVEFGNNRNCRIPMRKSAIVEVEKANSGSEEA